MKITKKKLIWLYRDLGRRLGKQPTKRQWLEDANTPSDMPVRINFGNWTKFIAVCGDDPLKVIPVGARKGRKNKNGVKRIETIHGYIHIFKPEHPLAMKNGYVREHRMIAYDAGIICDRNMVIHHKNGIKTDNRIENLEITVTAAHTSHHWKGAKQKPWTKKRCEAVSKRMKGNKNWAASRTQNF